jgi:hypothetical protein
MHRDDKNECIRLVIKHQEKRSLEGKIADGRLILMRNLKKPGETECTRLNWLTQRLTSNGHRLSFLDQLNNHNLLKENPLPWTSSH